MSSVEYQRTYYDKYLRASRGYVPKVDRAPVAAHIQACINAGMSITSIATAANVNYNTVWAITQRPTGKITQATRASILAVTPAARGTRHGLTRRVRALNRLGWTCGQIADEAGVHLSTIKQWRAGTVLEPGPSADDIVAAYDALSMLIPTPATRYERSAATRTIRAAEAAGFAPPLAWDDIDDPNAVPNFGAPVRGIDVNEWLYIVQAGEDPNRAAARLGVTVSGVARAAQTAGRNDIRRMAETARIREAS